MRNWARKSQTLLMQVPGVLHTRTSLDAGGPLLGLDVRQSEVEQSGMLDDVISHQIRDLLDGSVAATLSEEIEEVPIRVRLANSRWSDPIACSRSLSLLPSPIPKSCLSGSVADVVDRPAGYSAFTEEIRPDATSSTRTSGRITCRSLSRTSSGN